MKKLESIIRTISPGWALAREKSRLILNSYEVAKKSTRFRKPRGDNKSGDFASSEALPNMLKLARDLDQNNDLARGILSTLVNNTVGSGILVEPTVRLKNGDLDEDVNEQILNARERWAKRPEVTGEMDLPESERLAARSLFRDGEIFSQNLVGNVKNFSHYSDIPFSFELIESDMVPVTLRDDSKKIKYGIQRTEWGNPVFYHVYKVHPGDSGSILIAGTDTRRIPADKINHLKLVDRVRQSRGMSVFASTFGRLDDIRDFEESERFAARIAAAQVIAITKSIDSPSYLGDDENEGRSFDVSPGAMWDNLLPGEEPKIISSDRPNNNVESFRNGQMKGASAGTGANYSTISKTYDGTYSSQRQELVEGYTNYDVLTGVFISKFSKPNHENVVGSAFLRGLIRYSKDTDLSTILDADFMNKGMPWIDPDKETKAHERQVKNRFKAISQIIRSKGDNPMTVFRQTARDKKIMTDLKITPEDIFPPESTGDKIDNLNDLIDSK